MDPAISPTRSRLTFLAILFLLLLASLLTRWVTVEGPAVTAATAGEQSVDGLWQDVDEALLKIAGDRTIVPAAYRTVLLNWAELDALLALAPEHAAENGPGAVVMTLPLPDGRFGRFEIYRTAVMHPDLAAKFPEIQTFAGVGLDDPTAYARLDTTPKGFHAMILSVNGRVFIDPYSAAHTDLYQSYDADDFVPNLPADFEPDVVVEAVGEIPAAPEKATGALTSGATLRTYRLAVAATGEYTQFHGGTVSLAMAEITTAINRVSGIYEREVAIRLQLIPNNDAVIYTNGATDPYTNSNGPTMLSQNQSNLDSVIGSANYDIGHVFSTGGGGIAGLGVVCGGAKAQGVTGLSSPVGDPFYVDYVSHEMGHQFAGNHTFNSVTFACGGNNRNGSTAYEPGSASTIMGYAGICGADNIQNNSDDYFHAISFDEIVSYTTTGFGNTCAAVSSTGNTPPTVDAGASYSIPLSTPFILTPTLVSDPDGTASLTYNWEQFDLGPAGSPNSPSGDAPIFRSFSATSFPSRTFPRIFDIVNNVQTLGEILPSYGRTMNFRLTVRDNQTPAGGVAYDSTTVTAVEGTGPFLVTVPNTAVTWTGNVSEMVSWNVAGTDLAPINCANVNIDLSEDGGFSFPISLTANTPNDGSEAIIVPNISTSSARVRVACVGNIFFDISDASFNIQAGVGEPSLMVSKSVVPLGSVAPGDTMTYTVDVQNVGTAPASNADINDTFVTGLTNPVCNGVPGDLTVNVVINPASSANYTCTAVVDASLALDVDIAVTPAEILSGETVSYLISITNRHQSLSLNNVQVSAPGLTNCTPALNAPRTLGPGASQIYSCPNNVPGSPAATIATATGVLTLNNVATAFDPEDAGGLKSSGLVQSEVIVTGRDSAVVVFSDYSYQFAPIVAR